MILFSVASFANNNSNSKQLGLSVSHKSAEEAINYQSVSDIGMHHSHNKMEICSHRYFKYRVTHELIHCMKPDIIKISTLDQMLAFFQVLYYSLLLHFYTELGFHLHFHNVYPCAQLNIKLLIILI